MFLPTCLDTVYLLSLSDCNKGENIPSYLCTYSDVFAQLFDRFWYFRHTQISCLFVYFFLLLLFYLLLPNAPTVRRGLPGEMELWAHLSSVVVRGSPRQAPARPSVHALPLVGEVLRCAFARLAISVGLARLCGPNLGVPGNQRDSEGTHQTVPQ